MPLRSISDPRVFRCFFLALASISAACTIGCGSGSGSSSSTAKTSGIATADLDAHITVSAHEPGEVVVTASLEHDTGLDIEPVALSGDDSFRATAPDGDTRELARAGSSGSPRYRADFETSPAEGLVDVRFRGSDSTVRLRPEFTVTSPTRGEVFGFQDDLNFEWTPAEPGHVMRIWIRRSCRTTTGGTRGGSFFLQVPDTGDYAYDLGLLPEATDPAVDPSQDCSLEVELVREASAVIAPPFSVGSEMQSTQTRSVENLTITF